MPLTLEEQERLAYINGDTQRAALLARAIDGDELRFADLEQEIEHAVRKAGEWEERCADLEKELDALRSSHTRG